MSIFFLEQSGEQTSIRPFDLRDQGLLLADGVFDTSMIVDNDMILREAHIHRLVNDAAALGIIISHRKINDLVDQVLCEAHHGVLRITITSGPANRWNENSQKTAPTVFIHFSPLNLRDRFNPISLQISTIRRSHTSITSRHKTLSYTDNIVAQRAARAEGYDDAIFLNTSGNTCCVTTANLFLKFRDHWATPPISDGVLPGIMRQWILQTAPSLGLEIRERSISESVLPYTHSAFTTNSVRLVTPVSNINGQELPSELPSGLKDAVTKLIKSP